MHVNTGKMTAILALFTLLTFPALLSLIMPQVDEPGDPPGVVLARRLGDTQIYLGSPSIAILPNGDYIASFQQYGFGAAGKQYTFFYRSVDRGQTWEFQSRAEGMLYARVFVHRGKLYCMGTQLPQRSIVLSRSEDGGKNWTSPAAGVIINGEGRRLHTAATPVVENKGRLWMAAGDNEGPRGPVGRDSRIILLSVPANANLLDANNWQASAPLASQTEWIAGRRFGGWKEGNAVFTPKGEPAVLAQVLETDRGRRSALIHYDEEGKEGTFDPAEDLIELPGGEKKFCIRYDEKSKRYWALTNHFFSKDRQRVSSAGHALNMVALLYSENLRDWTVKEVLLFTEEVETQGFMEMNWTFDGEDIIALVGTAWADERGGAETAYRANYMCFHRFEDFRRK